MSRGNTGRGTPMPTKTIRTPTGFQGTRSVSILSVALHRLVQKPKAADLQLLPQSGRPDLNRQPPAPK